MVESQASDVADSSALQGFLSNYVPAATQRMPTSLNAYVPAGLSEAEWKARQKDEAAKKAANKLKYPKGPPFLGVKEYLTGLANKQTFKNGKVKDTGHVYVKTKYDWSGAKKDGSVRYNVDPNLKKDIADSSALQGFLSNYVPAATQRTPTS